MSGIEYLIILPLLVAPLIIGIFILVNAKRGGSGHPMCGGCGYDVTGTLAASRVVCPECGGAFAQVGIAPARAQNDRRRMVIGMTLVLIPLGVLFALAFVLPTILGPSRPPRVVPLAPGARSAASQFPQVASPASTSPGPATPPEPETLGESLPDR